MKTSPGGEVWLWAISQTTWAHPLSRLQVAYRLTFNLMHKQEAEESDPSSFSLILYHLLTHLHCLAYGCICSNRRRFIDANCCRSLWGLVSPGPMADVDACLEIFITHTTPDVKHAPRLIMRGGVGVFMDSTEQIERFVFLCKWGLNRESKREGRLPALNAHGCSFMIPTANFSVTLLQECHSRLSKDTNWNWTAAYVVLKFSSSSNSI